jgi:hypothetical protein
MRARGEGFGEGGLGVFGGLPAEFQAGGAEVGEDQGAFFVVSVVEAEVPVVGEGQQKTPPSDLLKTGGWRGEWWRNAIHSSIVTQLFIGAAWVKGPTCPRD